MAPWELFGVERFAVRNSSCRFRSHASALAGIDVGSLLCYNGAWIMVCIAVNFMHAVSACSVRGLGASGTFFDVDINATHSRGAALVMCFGGPRLLLEGRCYASPFQE